MRYLPGVFVAGLTVIALAGCGGNDSSDTSSDPTTSSNMSSASSSPTASTSDTAATSSTDPSVDSSGDSVATNVGLEAQAIGLDVADYTVKHDFTVPANQAAFKANVKYAHDLKPGSKVGYQAVGKNNFQVCVTHYVGSQPSEWSIFDGKTGLPKSGSGAPTAEFCP